MRTPTWREASFKFREGWPSAGSWTVLGTLAVSCLVFAACGDDAASEATYSTASTDADTSTGGSGGLTDPTSGTATQATSETSEDGCGAPTQLELTSPGASTTNPVWISVDAGASVVRVVYTAEGVFPIGESTDAGADFGVETTFMTLGPRTIEATAYDACDAVVATASVVSVIGEGDVDEPGELGDPVCYPGPEGLWDVCFDLVLPGELPDYDYPPALDMDPNYRAPSAYIDITGVDLGVALAPNFLFSELIKPSFGPYIVLQPHAIAHLQALRDVLGATQVISGFRNPSHNTSVGGATWSRHMYGDAFDLYPSETSLDLLFEACEAEGATYRQLYEGHVHCDWRAETVDTRFFGPAGSEAPAVPDVPDVALIADGDGWSAPATWDEGEPLRQWSAFDGEGAVLVEDVVGRRFVPPPGTARVDVIVGGIVHQSIAID